MHQEHRRARRNTGPVPSGQQHFAGRDGDRRGSTGDHVASLENPWPLRWAAPGHRHAAMVAIKGVVAGGEPADAAEYGAGELRCPGAVLVPHDAEVTVDRAGGEFAHPKPPERRDHLSV